MVRGTTEKTREISSAVSHAKKKKRQACATWAMHEQEKEKGNLAFDPAEKTEVANSGWTHEKERWAKATAGMRLNRMGQHKREKKEREWADWTSTGNQAG